MYITFKDFENLTEKIKAENEKRLMACHENMTEENIIAFNELDFAIKKAYAMLERLDRTEEESL